MNHSSCSCSRVITTYTGTGLGQVTCSDQNVISKHEPHRGSWRNAYAFPFGKLTLRTLSHHLKVQLLCKKDLMEKDAWLFYSPQLRLQTCQWRSHLGHSSPDGHHMEERHPAEPGPAYRTMRLTELVLTQPGAFWVVCSTAIDNKILHPFLYFWFVETCSIWGILILYNIPEYYIFCNYFSQSTF